MSPLVYMTSCTVSASFTILAFRLSLRFPQIITLLAYRTNSSILEIVLHDLVTKCRLPMAYPMQNKTMLGCKGGSNLTKLWRGFSKKRIWQDLNCGHVCTYPMLLCFYLIFPCLSCWWEQKRKARVHSSGSKCLKVIHSSFLPFSHQSWICSEETVYHLQGC